MLSSAATEAPKPTGQGLTIDCHNHIGADPRFLIERFPYAQDLPTMVFRGSRAGVDRWVVFPMSFNLTFNLTALRRGEFSTDNGFETVPYAFENRRLMREIHEYFPEFAPMIFPFAMVDPMRRQKEQVESLKLLHQEYRIHGLKIQATTLRSDISSLLGDGRCLLRLAAELDLPFIIHSSVGADPWSQAESILHIAESTPEVRFCLAHSCRFDQPCLERVADLPNTWFDCSAHRIHCAAAVSNLEIIAPPSRRFPSRYEDPEQVLHELALRYPHKLMWGSDSPYYSYISDELALKSTYEAEVGCLDALPLDLRQRIAGVNTKIFLGIRGAEA